jgi:glycerol-3-phosphate O-acyltransferase
VRSVVALEAVLRRQIAKAEARDIVLHIPRGDISYAMEVGLRALIEAGHVTRIGDRVAVSAAGSEFLAFYAASIAHLIGDQADNPHTLDEKIRFSAT